MKIKFTKGNSLSIDKNCKSQNGTFSGILKSALMLLVLFACYFNANAQEQRNIIPVANIKGPQKASVNGSNIVVTTEVEVFVVGTPIIAFSLTNNTSGATIVSQGTYQVDPKTGIGYETVTINPGTVKGTFNIEVNATNSASDIYKGKASMGVVVL